jgi:SAM-dependent methyltransferase
VSARDIYVHGPAFDAQLTHRAAAREGAFFLPHLRAGMRVLDCGCGPGSITIGLAAAVAPGQAVGIDREGRQIAAARALAAEQGVANVAFEVGSVYDLPFPDAAFDAAFANSVLFHLSEPLAALRQIRRVLKPDGVVGIRDPEFGAEVVAPPTPRLRRWRELEDRVWAHNGASPMYARHQRRLLLEAGFARSEAQASVRGGGTLELTRAHAEHMRTRLAEALAWGERPDAFFAIPLYSAVGWVSA